MDADKLKIRVGRRLYPVKRCLPHDAGIKGSYYTGNIGDRAIGEAIKTELNRNNHDAFLFHREARKGNAQLSILGGGGVLHDWQGVNILKKRLQFLTKGDVIMGVGAPGILSDKAKVLVGDKLEELSLVTVRDPRSKSILKDVTEADIFTTACPAFLHEDPEIEVQYRTGVNFRPWFDMKRNLLVGYFGYDGDLDVDNAKERYIANAQQIVDEVDDPVFIPFHKKDATFAENYLDIKVLNYRYSVQKTLERVSQVDKMVCTRYHSLIFSAICDKPILPITYAPKVSSLAQRLELSTHKPHGNLNIIFDQPNNVDVMKQYAKSNFTLLEKHTNTNNAS